MTRVIKNCYKAVLLMMFVISQQNVFSESGRVDNAKDFPYYFYHYSKCSNDEAFVDSLLHDFEGYSRAQKVQLVDFAVDTLLPNGQSIVLQQFLYRNARKIDFTKRQKDKIMEITLRQKAALLIGFWANLNDTSYVKPLHELWLLNTNSNVNKCLESTLFTLGDDSVVEKWMNFVETEPINNDTLSANYYIIFSQIIRFGKNKRIYDRLMGVMLQFPDRQVCVDFAYPNVRHAYEPLSMLFYRSMDRNIKNAPSFDFRMKRDNSVTENGVKSFNFPPKYKRKYLDWIKAHLRDYEFVDE